MMLDIGTIHDQKDTKMGFALATHSQSVCQVRQLSQSTQAQMEAIPNPCFPSEYNHAQVYNCGEDLLSGKIGRQRRARLWE